MEDRLDATDLPLLDPEQLRQLPGPVDAVVVEEPEREHDAAFTIHGHEAAVAHAIDDALQAFLELLPAGRCACHRAPARPPLFSKRTQSSVKG